MPILALTLSLFSLPLLVRGGFLRDEEKYPQRDSVERRNILSLSLSLSATQILGRRRYNFSIHYSLSAAWCLSTVKLTHSAIELFLDVARAQREQKRIPNRVLRTAAATALR